MKTQTALLTLALVIVSTVALKNKMNANALEMDNLRVNEYQCRLQGYSSMHIPLRREYLVQKSVLETLEDTRKFKGYDLTNFVVHTAGDYYFYVNDKSDPDVRYTVVCNGH